MYHMHPCIQDMIDLASWYLAWMFIRFDWADLFSQVLIQFVRVMLSLIICELYIYILVVDDLRCIYVKLKKRIKSGIHTTNNN